MGGELRLPNLGEQVRLDEATCQIQGGFGPRPRPRRASASAPPGRQHYHLVGQKSWLDYEPGGAGLDPPGSRVR